MAEVLRRCAACGRMSELGGDWVFPEAFHHKRGSNVTLMRGLCPSCVTRLYEQRDGRLVRLPAERELGAEG